MSLSLRNVYRWSLVAGMLVALSCLGLPAVAQATKAAKRPAVAKGPAESATIPAPRPDKKWQDRQASMNARVKQGKVDLLLIGDSITHGWEGAGKDVWSEYYGKRNAVNLGIGGDRTQHVLWRLQNGNLDGITPKLAVLMIGTNNASAGNTPEQIAAGVKAIVETIQTRSPQTKVLILAIFPRGPDNNDARRQVNMKTNAILAKLADGQKVLFQDFGNKFLKPDGQLTKDVMPDLLHLNAASYKIWAESIEPTVAAIVGPK